jgi:hypothetical protein
MAVDNFDLFQDVVQSAPNLPKFVKKSENTTSAAAITKPQEDQRVNIDVKVAANNLNILDAPVPSTVSYRKTPSAITEQTETAAMDVDEPPRESLPPGTLRSILSKTITPDVDPLKPRKKRKSVKFSAELEKVKLFTAEEGITVEVGKSRAMHDNYFHKLIFPLA